jgi:hypothetical protein
MAIWPSWVSAIGAARTHGLGQLDAPKSCPRRHPRAGGVVSVAVMGAT